MREVYWCLLIHAWIIAANSYAVQSSVAADRSGSLKPSSADLSSNRREDYEAFALTQQGDAKRGKSLFENEKKAACSKCHSTDGSRKGVGPDLFAIGDKFERHELIRSLLYPSSQIAIGYGVTIIQTVSGRPLRFRS